MAKTLVFRNAPTTGLASIVGTQAELFVDTTLNTVVVMDGVTSGGTTLARNADVQSLSSVTATNIATVSSNAYIAATTKATSSTFGIVRADGTSVLVTGGVISIATVQTDGTSISSVAGVLKISTSSNGFGIRTISTSTPTGGSNGDIWLQVTS
jgi:hypothetical protein